MGTFIIIYLIGWIFALVYAAAMAFSEFREHKYLDYSDLFFVIVLPWSSWITVITFIIFTYFNLFEKILYDARDKEEE